MHGENTLKARNLWAEEEDRILRSEVVKQGTCSETIFPKRLLFFLQDLQRRDWANRETGELLQRSSLEGAIKVERCEDCRKRWIKLDSKINKGPWSQEENKRLHEAVAKYSTVWTEVAQVVGTRQPDRLNRSEWTPEEDGILVAEVEKRGRNWKQIVDEVLHRRSANDAKNRFTILQRMRTNTNNNSTSTSASPAGQRRLTMSRRMTATTAESSMSPSPQPDILPGFYGLTPESMGGSNPGSSHLQLQQQQQQQYGETHITPISTSELGHDPDLSLSHMFFHGGNGKEPSPNTAAATTATTSPSYLGGTASGGTPEILGGGVGGGEMDTDQGSVSLESWVDYVMGTGLLTAGGTDCSSSTPALCHDDGDGCGRMDRGEEEGGELMHLDAPPHPPHHHSTSSTATNTDTDPTNLDWNWDQIPDIDLPTATATTTTATAMTAEQNRDREAEEAIIRKNRTMILHQMQPEQISRVMDFLLSWNTPIDVKIVNPE
ncbi:DNA-binding protein [Aspergillus ustus]|uniref:DNA-binding protein n=1 Tax=Aspergillus ustus TaxID=40382 RepID=A0A0C1E636_ASPUT|nr:DNA-binding protein [Aspergillus ustus]